MEKNMNLSFKQSNKKLLFQYMLILISSLCIGIFLPRFLGEDFLQSLYQKIALHFQAPVYGVEKTSDWINIIFKYSLSDIICICIVSLLSFSSLTSIVSGSVIVYVGIKIGCQISLVYLTFIANIEYPPSFAEMCVFFILKTLIVLFLMRYIVYSSLFSSTVCYSDSNNEFVLRTLKFIVTSLLYICIFLFFYGIYCFAIKSI